MAVVQVRYDTEGRTYYLRKRAAGKTLLEALRCVKRRLSDVIYHQLILDARAPEAGPGGHSGATTESSATGPTPAASSSDKSLPRPATPSLRPSSPPPVDTEGSQIRMFAVTALQRSVLGSGGLPCAGSSPDETVFAGTWSAAGCGAPRVPGDRGRR
jgi:hypothetical protein